MRHTPNERSRGRQRQRGQSMIEYVVICAMLALVLFAGSPVGKQFAQAIRDFYSNLIFYISLP